MQKAQTWESEFKLKDREEGSGRGRKKMGIQDFAVPGALYLPLMLY